MTKDSRAPTADQSGASPPAGDERDREPAGTPGNAREKGEAPSPDDRERGETAPGGDQPPPPIDLDAARDRAS